MFLVKGFEEDEWPNLDKSIHTVEWLIFTCDNFP